MAVRLTFTLRNPGITTSSLTPKSSTDGITVSQGSTVVWHSARTVASYIPPLTIPGCKVIKWTSTWNGRPNQGGLKRLPPGVYTVQATEGGYSATATGGKDMHRRVGKDMHRGLKGHAQRREFRHVRDTSTNCARAIAIVILPGVHCQYCTPCQ